MLQFLCATTHAIANECATKFPKIVYNSCQRHWRRGKGRGLLQFYGHRPMAKNSIFLPLLARKLNCEAGTAGAVFATFRCIRTGTASFAYKAEEVGRRGKGKGGQEVIPQPFHMHSSSKFAVLRQPVNDSWNVWAAAAYKAVRQNKRMCRLQIDLCQYTIYKSTFTQLRHTRVIFGRLRHCRRLGEKQIGIVGKELRKFSSRANDVANFYWNCHKNVS